MILNDCARVVSLRAMCRSSGPGGRSSGAGAAGVGGAGTGSPLAELVLVLHERGLPVPIGRHSREGREHDADREGVSGVHEAVLIPAFLNMLFNTFLNMEPAAKGARSGRAPVEAARHATRAAGSGRFRGRRAMRTGRGCGRY